MKAEPGSTTSVEPGEAWAEVVRQGSQRVKAAGWLAHTDPAGLLYGAIVSAAVLVYVVAHTAGADIAGAAAVAVYFTVFLLAAVGYLGAHQPGLRGRAVLFEVAGAASFGVLIVAAKALLH